MDTTEVTALKAIMFFDYTASQLTRNNIKKVKRIRNQVFLENCFTMLIIIFSLRSSVIWKIIFLNIVNIQRGED